ncbi:hypothetical protein AAC387_Pa07g1088 [Persea americana]
MDETKEEMQQLRCKASELLLRQEWKESINIYSQLISLCEQHLSSSSEFKRCLCLVLTNRAEARSRLRDFSRAIEDCDRALLLQTEGTHVKALLCKEYIGPVQIKKSEQGGGRGLFATKSIDAGTLLLVTKAVAIGRAIVDDDHDESAHLVMWKDLVNKVFSASTTCPTTLHRIYALSTGKHGAEEVPDMRFFTPNLILMLKAARRMRSLK